MIGVPPTAGFLGKWFILVAAVQVRAWFAIAVIVISTLLNAGYLLPIVYRAFMPARTGEDGAVRTESPWPMVAALVATAMLTLVLFLWPGVLLGLAERLAGNAAVDAAGSAIVQFVPEAAE
jgi:multicomponent Na+:H+ antiporter subunit D